MYIYTHMYIYIYMYVCIYIYIYTPIHTLLCMYIHVSMQVVALPARELRPHRPKMKSDTPIPAHFAEPPG